jgi:carboxylesterase type B
VGDLRFAAPQPIDTQKPYVAANFGFDCPLSASKPVTNYPELTPQALDVIKYFSSGAGTPQSEDCLTLNIWTKATEKASQAKKPVLVFFYGGRRFSFLFQGGERLLISVQASALATPTAPSTTASTSPTARTWSS